MRNAYDIRGAITAIVLRRRDGSTLETLIDTEDLPLVGSVAGTWSAMWSPQPRTFYVRHDAGGRRIRLHRLITSAPFELEVDHVNHDGLDNRKRNLRIVTCSLNHLNRRAARPESISGIRGVGWIPERGKWRARMEYMGRTRHLGYFVSSDEARLAVMRALEDLGLGGV